MLHPIARRSSAAVALAVPLLLAGCATPAPPAPARPPAAAPAPAPAPAAPPPILPVEAEPRAPATQLVPPSPGPIGAMLAYADRVRGLSSNDLQAEINRLGEPGDTPALQMQLGLALSQTRSSPDLARALGLMQRAASNNTADGLALQPLARLLASRYLEQRRVEDDRDRQAQQLRDAQRRIDQLNDRIEALRAIERSFSRPAAPAAAPNGTKP
ncbi:Uncharacterised protein [Xylophilus ampelinus]|nr:hypothetical protein [Variovorax sp.]VTY34787.1 Uncharacterised protein [Xylophilus ampelinus]